MSKTLKEHLKNWEMPSAEEVRERMCEGNLKSKNPRRCKTCNSKYMYFDSMAGPIVGGVFWGNKHPDAHPTGAWICLDCSIKEVKEQRRYEKEQKRKEAPELIEKKKTEIEELEKEIKELEKLIG